MKKLLSLLCVAAITSLAVSAQNHPALPSEGEVKVIFNAGEPDEEVYNAFIENAPKRFNEPGAPRFAIIGKENMFYLGIGGVIKGVGLFDWGNPIDSPDDFTTADIPFDTPEGNGGKLQGSFGQSKIFINLVALPGTANRFGAYISGKFTGPGNAFKLNHAYVTYRGFIVGHTASLFEDGAAAPPTIDDEGPCGLVGVTNDLINYTHSFGKGFKAGVGIELSSVSMTTTGSTRSVSQRIPDIPAYVQYSWNNGNGWLRISALMRNIQYRDLVDSKNRNKTCWGVKLSGSTPIGSTPLQAYYQAAYGRGIGGYIQDLAGLGLDLSPEEGNPGHLEAVKAWGAYAGLQYTFSKKVFASASYSQTRSYAGVYTGGTTPWDRQYKYAQYVAANVFYTILPGLQCGVEYLYGRRVDMDGISHSDNRINTMLQLSF